MLEKMEQMLGDPDMGSPEFKVAGFLPISEEFGVRLPLRAHLALWTKEQALGLFIGPHLLTNGERQALFLLPTAEGIAVLAGHRGLFLSRSLPLEEFEEALQEMVSLGEKEAWEEFIEDGLRLIEQAIQGLVNTG